MRSMANIVVSRLAESAVTQQNVSCAASSVGGGFSRRLPKGDSVLALIAAMHLSLKLLI
jgi:hypothetical protein